VRRVLFSSDFGRGDLHFRLVFSFTAFLVDESTTDYM
jgi:hypothetical protein